MKSKLNCVVLSFDYRALQVKLLVKVNVSNLITMSLPLKGDDFNSRVFN